MLEEKNNYDYMDERLPDDGGRSLEDIISAVGEQDLAEIPHVPMTPERLAALAAARDAEEKAKKRKRRCKLAGGIAAVFVLILIGAVVAFNALSVDVGADKNKKEEIVTEDGVVIEDGGYGAEYEGNSWSTEDWNEVRTFKSICPQLMIPKYIPVGYEFDVLHIEHLDTEDLIFEYMFIDEKGATIEIEGFVQKSGEISIDIEDISKIIESSKGTVYIQDYENKIATIQIDDGKSIYIISVLSDEELIKIINKLSI